MSTRHTRLARSTQARIARAVFAAKGRRCHLCGRDGADSIDHLIPLSAGGTWTTSNLAPAHHGCNSARRDMPLSDWFAAHPLPRRTPLTPSRQW